MHNVNGPNQPVKGAKKKKIVPLNTASVVG